MGSSCRRNPFLLVGRPHGGSPFRYGPKSQIAAASPERHFSPRFPTGGALSLAAVRGTVFDEWFPRKRGLEHAGHTAGISSRAPCKRGRFWRLARARRMPLMIPPQTEQLIIHALTAGRSVIISPQVEQLLQSAYDISVIDHEPLQAEQIPRRIVAFQGCLMIPCKRGKF